MPQLIYSQLSYLYHLGEESKLHRDKLTSEVVRRQCSTLYDTVWRLLNMAKKTSGKSSWREIEFSSAVLTEDDEDGFTQFCASIGDGWHNEVETMVASGWKMSLKWDGENDCFIASFTNELERDRNYNICCTSRSDNAAEAMLMGLYKISHKYAGQRLPTRTAKNNWG